MPFFFFFFEIVTIIFSSLCISTIPSCLWACLWVPCPESRYDLWKEVEWSGLLTVLSYMFLPETSEMGLLSTLLQWNKLDPPSRMEKLRNDRICKLYQHNRNPFIDHPEYANLIWKYATDEGKVSLLISSWFTQILLTGNHLSIFLNLSQIIYFSSILLASC